MCIRDSNTFNDTVINAVSQQSWRRWRGVLGEWRGYSTLHLHTCDHLTQHICIRLLQCKTAARSTLHDTKHDTLLKNLIRDTAFSAAVISISCDGHCVVEYHESRSPVGPGILRYGDLPKKTDLMDHDIGNMDTSTSMHCWFNNRKSILLKLLQQPQRFSTG